MPTYGTLSIYVYCYAFFGNAQQLSTKRQLVQKHRGISRSEAQELVNKLYSTLLADQRSDYTCEFQPDAETLEYSTAIR